MTSSTITAVNHNEPMDPPHPRADGPRRRRAFTASDKIAHLHAYEQACEHGEGGAYLRREGLYSSLISEWRKQRDAGVLAGKRPGEKVGRLTAEQAEIARLTRELARANKRLHTTEAVLDIMGKHTLSWSHCPRERTPTSSARSADRDLRNADRTWCIDKAGSHIDRAGPLDRDSAAQRRHGAHTRSLHRACRRAGQQTHRCRTAPGR